MIEPFTPLLKESPDTLEMTNKKKTNPKPKGYHIIIMDVH